jgi:hypothetical protein
MSVRLEFVGLAEGATFETRGVEALNLTLEGIQGDRHAGLTMKANVRQKHVTKGRVIRNSRQLSLLSVEELEAIAHALELPRIAPEWLGANLVVSGLSSFTQLQPSTRLVFESGACVAIDGHNVPCVLSGGALARACDDPTLRHRFVKAAMGKRGLVGWVEAEGLIRRGESVTVVPR